MTAIKMESRNGTMIVLAALMPARIITIAAMNSAVLSAIDA
jgi:hypothetical protein